MEDHQAPAADKPARRLPWNKGKLVGAKPPLRPSHVWSIRTKLQMEGRKRDLALFNLAIDSKLRGCDVVAVRVDDVAPEWLRDGSRDDPAEEDWQSGAVRTHRPDSASDRRVPEADGGSRASFFSPVAGRTGGLTTRQYARLVQEWVASIGLDPAKFGTHSLRRTKAVLIYRRTGNLRAVQLLLGHSKIESTVRYLGIEVDDAIEIAEKIDI